MTASVCQKVSLADHKQPSARLHILAASGDNLEETGNGAARVAASHWAAR